MVDIHCHILPGVDDGAKDWDVALAMCRMAIIDGIDHIVATPHANNEFVYNREEHEEKLEKLRTLVAGSIQLSLGCDFHLSYDNIQDALRTPGRYCIGNTQYLLVEFSDYSLPPNTTDVLEQFLSYGLTPIITHPERHPILQRKSAMVVQWARQGAVVQVTANSLTGRWGPIARKCIEELAKNEAVHVIASDAHGVNSRPPILSEAREVMTGLVGREVASALVQENPQAIVSGEPLFYSGVSRL